MSFESSTGLGRKIVIIMLCFGFGATVHAQTINLARQVNFSIPPQKLSAALIQFSHQAKIQLIIPEDLGNQTSGGISGVYSVGPALTQLLAKTGLVFHGVSASSIAIQKPIVTNGPGPLTDASQPAADSSGAVKYAVSSAHGTEMRGALTTDRPWVPSDQDATLETIVVTAQKRLENSIDVPMSVTVITAKNIADSGASSLEDLQYTIPGLATQKDGIGEQRLELRGVSANTGQPTVGTYFDEMPINTDFQSGMDIRLLDIERVEVLRGPQGTFYGEGSMGGTVKFVTASPDLNEVLIRAETQGSAVESGSPAWKANGVVSIPVIDSQLGVRLLAAHEEDGGFIDAVNAGRKNVNEVDFDTFRAKILWEPTAQFSASLLVLNQHATQDSQNIGLANRTTSSLILTPVADRYTLANLVLSYDFGFAALTASSGYLDRKLDQTFDISSFYVPVLPLFGFPPGFVASVGLAGRSQIKTRTQEIRLSSNGANRWNYTIGAYYKHEAVDTSLETATAPNSLPFFLLADAENQLGDAYSLFGNTSYKLTQRFEASVGGRYFLDRRRQTNSGTNFGSTTPLDVNSGRFHSFDPRVDLKYTPAAGHMYYVNAAEGFRSGGFNLQSAGLGVFPIPPSFAPEKIWSYEAGTKHVLDRGRVGLDAAVYYNDWSNIQTSEFAPGSPVTITVNGGHASGWGADGAIYFRPVERLSVAATVSHNDMRYHSTTLDHHPGDPTDYTPAWTYSGSAEYGAMLSGTVGGFLRLEVQYTDAYQITTRNVPPPVARSDAFMFVNLRTGATHGRWRGEVFATNLFDRNGSVQPPIGVLTEPVLPRPREIGLNLKFNY